MNTPVVVVLSSIKGKKTTGEELNIQVKNAHHSNVISKQEKLDHFEYLITLFIQQGEMLGHSWLILRWQTERW